MGTQTNHKKERQLSDQMRSQEPQLLKPALVVGPWKQDYEPICCHILQRINTILNCILSVLALRADWAFDKASQVLTPTVFTNQKNAWGTKEAGLYEEEKTYNHPLEDFLRCHVLSVQVAQNEWLRNFFGHFSAFGQSEVSKSRVCSVFSPTKGNNFIIPSFTYTCSELHLVRHFRELSWVSPKFHVP